jgi:hypothetical protein
VPSNVLVLEKEIPLEMEGIKIGKVQAQVFEADPVHLQQGDMNEKYLVAKGVFNDKKYEVKGIRGGVQKVLEDLIEEIQNDLK